MSERSFEELRSRLEADPKATFSAVEMLAVLECVDALDGELADAVANEEYLRSVIKELRAQIADPQGLRNMDPSVFTKGARNYRQR